VPDLLLAYPPTTDPTVPYHAIPYLKGYLRAHGEDAAVADINVEACHWLLSGPVLRRHGERVARRVAELEARPALDYLGRKEYFGARPAAAAWERIARDAPDALHVFRDPERFYDPAAYAGAVSAVNEALALVSAAHFPLRLAFTEYDAPFGFTSEAEARAELDPARNPFVDFYRETVLPRLRAAPPRVLGLSLVYTSQLAQGFALAALVREALPGVHLTAGGPALTQLMLRNGDATLAAFLRFFDSLVAYEGEEALLQLLRAVREGRPVAGIPHVAAMDSGAVRFERAAKLTDVNAVPGPDTDGLPWDLYLSPEPVVFYAPSRGCYWGRCSFCHYGLTDATTVAYREVQVERIVEDLARLQRERGARVFYFCDDLMSPRLLLKLSQALIDAQLDLRWASDVKIEKSLTPERCALLKRAGCVAVTLGVESLNQRVLDLIDKGLDSGTTKEVVKHLAEAGIATQAMTFLDHPTETWEEARETLAFLEEYDRWLALFFVVNFDLEPGALVYRDPARYDLQEVYHLDGDDFRLWTYSTPLRKWKTPEQQADLTGRVNRLFRRYGRRHYPFAGSVSVPHTLLYFIRFGNDVFKELGARSPAARPARGARPRVRDGVTTGFARFDLNAIGEELPEREAAIWEELTGRRRRLSRDLYRALATEAGDLPANGSTYVFRPGATPIRIAPELKRLLRLCDGTRTIGEIAAMLRADPHEIEGLVRDLEKEEVVQWVTSGSPRPSRT